MGFASVSLARFFVGRERMVVFKGFLNVGFDACGFSFVMCLTGCARRSFAGLKCFGGVFEFYKQFLVMVYVGFVSGYTRFV